MREFEGIWIPKPILEIKELELSEKVVLSCIYFLGLKQVCNVSNEYLAENLGLSISGVKKILDRLQEKHFIKRITNGRKRDIFLSTQSNLINILEVTKSNLEYLKSPPLSTQQVYLSTQSNQYNIDNISNNKDTNKSIYKLEDLRKDMGKLFNKI